MFADLHCHPALYVFNRLRNTKAEGDPSTFNAWVKPKIRARKERDGGRATHYSQAHPRKMAEGDMRIAYASITPIERGFMHLRGDQTDWVHELVSLFYGRTLFKIGKGFLRADRNEMGLAATGVLRNNGPIRLLFQRVFLGYGLKRIEFFRSEEYDYWDEYLRELEFYYNGEKLEVNGWKYELIENAKAFSTTVADEKKLALILTIEGGHTFSMDPNDELVSGETIFSRIAFMKSQKWPVFFITFAHHFDNGLCGHAKSILDSGSWILDQRKRMGEGFTEFGIEVLRKLLSVDAKNRDLEERRILIDCKHMSPRSRKYFYDSILQPYNRRRSRKREKIPVIFSHAAYNGFDSLEQLIENSDQESDTFCSEAFLGWGVNYCDEDIRAVFESDGLIGLCFDKRICGVSCSKLKGLALEDALFGQIFATVSVIFADPKISKRRKQNIWNCLSIGSDYDGLIDPIPKYATATELHSFASDLRSALEKRQNEFEILNIGIDELVEKISWKNAYEFGMKHLKSNAKIT